MSRLKIKKIRHGGKYKMQSNLIDKYIKLSRIIITFLVFIVLNCWFLYENDPQWIFSIIISVLVLVISFPSSKICKFFINKGDKIESKILKVLYYIFALPIVFTLLLFIVGIFCSFVVTLLENAGSLSLGSGILIAFIGIGIFTCVLVPYFQTLIILILRYFFKGKDN